MGISPVTISTRCHVSVLYPAQLRYSSFEDILHDAEDGINDLRVGSKIDMPFI